MSNIEYSNVAHQSILHRGLGVPGRGRSIFLLGEAGNLAVLAVQTFRERLPNSFQLQKQSEVELVGERNRACPLKPQCVLQPKKKIKKVQMEKNNFKLQII